MSLLLAYGLGCKADGDRRPWVPWPNLPAAQAGGTASAASAPSAGSGGSVTAPPAGTGGSGTMVGGAGTMVVPPAAGGGGSGGGGGESTGGPLTYESCLDGLRAGGQPITACEECMCSESGCLAHIDGMREDAPGTEMIACVLENQCDQECCLCGAKCGLTNYGKGPCAREIETAAGLNPGAGLGNVAGIMRNCVPEGPADNSCAKASRMGVCIAEKCATMCNVPSTCM